jgi:uncharacterized protein involved in response to NO
MATTSEQIRAWTGPALLSYGFRPFFLGAAAWAAFAMMAWIAMITGWIQLPTVFDPVSWHSHEFLFGYLSAALAGFLLTAVPNWTGRLPIVGWPLAGLFGLWLLGRLVVLVSAGLPPLAVAVADLALPLALAAFLLREIVAGKNWNNLVVLALLAVFTLGNVVFHWQATQGEFAAQGIGLRIGLGAGLMMVAVIGGRITPSFTRNWLVRQPVGLARLPAAPMQRFDKAALLVLLLALLTWIALPDARLTAALLALAGAAHLARLSRWAGDRTWREPLLLVLHAAYLFLPLGALTMAAAILIPDRVPPAVAQHLWMAGAIGMMTLAVMTRATLGHTGQALAAGPGTTVLYLALATAVAARIITGLWPTAASFLLDVSALAWILAFGGFVVIYGPLLMQSKRSRKRLVS